ncbi:helix-turn-helix transcriptional regulator [Candidatus Saccharibacteria bacterium]|nr:MAG: helix-turn-helix transcriptional regulator [Candidatus Saccharibacteria bacterium]
MTSQPTFTNLEPQIGCIASALRVIGQKWTALIIRDLYAGPKRFGELEKSVGTINPRTLSQRLEALETHGVVTKKTYAEVPPRTEYTLTAKGYDLVPVLQTMAAWGNKYHEEC